MFVTSILKHIECESDFIEAKEVLDRTSSL